MQAPAHFPDAREFANTSWSDFHRSSSSADAPLGGLSTAYETNSAARAATGVTILSNGHGRLVGV
jgi:hypothetical protein